MTSPITTPQQKSPEKSHEIRPTFLLCPPHNCTPHTGTNLSQIMGFNGSHHMGFSDGYLFVISFIVVLLDIIYPDSSKAVETIIKLFTLSSQIGRVEIIVISIAIIVLVRNLPIFIKEIKGMIND